MSDLAPSFKDSAAAARVRYAQRADGAIVIYAHDGRASIGRLHRNPSGWAAVEDLTGDADSGHPTPDVALAALLRLAEREAAR